MLLQLSCSAAGGSGWPWVLQLGTKGRRPGQANSVPPCHAFTPAGKKSVDVTGCYTYLDFSQMRVQTWFMPSGHREIK